MLPIGFTQADTQQLLHLLRNDLDHASFHKRCHKEDAATLWQECDKDSSNDYYIAKSFRNFSDSNSMYKYWSKREKALVSLITKLKRGAK
jgi:hypothetical protein